MTASRRVAAALLLAAVLLGAAGCERAGIAAARYRAEQLLWTARRTEAQLRQSGARPDSALLLRVRDAYETVRASTGHRLERRGQEPMSRDRRDLLRTVGSAELTGARLALDANRPDLALEQSRWLHDNAAGDTIVARQADFVVSAALRQLHRYDEAVDHMHRMLREYPPQPPDRAGAEDAILALPEAIVDLRRQSGDDAQVRAEQERAVAYFHGVLASASSPELETQVRSRLVRVLLDEGASTQALAQVDTLEALIQSREEFRSLRPEIRYARAKIRGMNAKDRTEAIRLLDALAADYPTSPLAASAMLDAGIYLEDQKRYAQAGERYKSAVASPSAAVPVASLALFREAMIEDRLGNWDQAVRLLQSITVRYPGTRASIEAPWAIANHYARAGDRSGARAALEKAAGSYRIMLGSAAAGPAAAYIRWNILKCYLAMGSPEPAMKAVDELVAKHPGNPYTAQALLEGAKIAKSMKLNSAAAAYLRRFLDDYPGSPVEPAVRRELQTLGP